MEKDFLNYEELKKKVYEKDLALFNEVIICIENEAYRGASILTWISVLESLVRKLKKLASNDDEIYKTIKNFKANENEKELLEKCEKHQLITKLEYSRLNAIRQARNTYAHVSDESPKKEDVLINLHYAVEYVLSKPIPFPINLAKNELKNVLNDSKFFGNANDEQIEEYAKTFTKKIANKNRDEIIKKLFKMIEKKFEKNDINYYDCIEHALIYAKVLLLNNLDYLTSDNCNNLINNSKITSCHIFTELKIWKTLDKRSKERICGYTLNNNSTTKIEFINKFYKLYFIDKVNDELKTNFEEYINNLSLEKLKYCKIPANEYYDKLIKEFKSHVYNHQNPAADIIRFKDLSVFNDEQLEQLGRNLLQSAEGGAYNSEKAILKFERTKKLPKALLKGLLYETIINDENELRINPGYFEIIINILNEKSYKDELFDELIECIKQSKPKSLDFTNYEIAIKRFKRFKIKPIQSKLLIDATYESLKKSSNEFIENIFDIKYPNEYKIYLPDCLSEKNRKKFINLGCENPIEFIKFFTEIQYEGIVKIKEININFELIEQFIEYDKLKYAINKLEYNELSQNDKMIIDYFNKYNSI